MSRGVKKRVGGRETESEGDANAEEEADKKLVM